MVAQSSQGLPSGRAGIGVSDFAPASGEEASDIIRDACANNRTMCVEGGGTRTGLGRPVVSDDTLSTRNLSGILIYEPAEMMIRARAGTPLAEIEAALESNNQMLPFEPVDYRHVYGTQGSPSIGALAACNLSGSRRIRAGAARDSLIGVRFINGAGQELSSGGRVMKNVTGLDLVKLQAGAFGTLGLLTEVTFKLLPKPEATGSLVLDSLDEVNAIKAMGTALQSPFEVSAAAHVVNASGGTQTAIRVEQFKPSVDYRLGELQKRLAEFGTARVLEDQESQSFWQDVRDVKVLSCAADSAIWRISIRPSAATASLQNLRNAGLQFQSLLDHGGGLIWLSVDADGDAGAGKIRSAIPAGAGHAMLVRAPDAVRQSVPVFQPLAEPVMKLTAGIKKSLDAGGIFNPGRMYAGI
jgi:glycolate oxidase FAD binding subunit